MSNQFIKSLLCLAFISTFVQTKASDNNKNATDKSLVIQGDEKALQLSDIPLAKYSYDDSSFLTKNFQPDKELLSLLDSPDVLIELDNKAFALDFDEQN